MARKLIFDGSIIHCNASRIRVTGVGILQQSLRTLDDTIIYSMPNVTLNNTTNREITTLANFQDQHFQLKLGTSEIDEVFRVSRIIIYVKPVASGYPQ